MVSFKSVGGPKKYFKYKECENGQILVIGKFIGKAPNKFGHENFEFEPLEGGATVCLNHAGHLAYLMDTYIAEGEVVKIVYSGKKVLEKGAMKGKESHQFEVYKADAEVEEGVQVGAPKDEEMVKAEPMPQQDNEDISLEDLA